MDNSQTQALHSVAAQEQYGNVLINQEQVYWDALISQFDTGEMTNEQLWVGVAKISAVRALQRQLNSEMKINVAKAQKELNNG